MRWLLMMALLATAVIRAGSASADSGNCASNMNNKFSSVCYYKDAQFSGAYAEWQSTTLNISQSAANAGGFIAEHLIVRDRYSDPIHSSFLEVGDTAGGGNIPGHVNEWARMLYWIDASVVYTEHFIQYAPNDGLNRGWKVEWDSAQADWVISIAGTPKAVVTTWKQPSDTAGLKILTGLEVLSGGQPLDASKNSGLFANKAQAWRDLNNTWWGWDIVWQQVDSPCGSPPTCLQGWWTGIWNNAKPAP
jgi:hypothetical protein